MAKQTKKEAVAYCRVSSKGQQKDGTGLDRQEEIITAFAKKKGYKLVGVYKEAMTGTDADRPEFAQMLADLLSNGCRVIIVERLDRLARDLGVQLQLVGLLCSKGVTLFSADTEQDITVAFSGDPMLKAMIQVQGVFSELDKSMLVKKLRKARETKKAKTGRCEGRKPFGHYPGEAETLKRMKQLYRKLKDEKRLGFYQIATILNKEGRPTRKGTPWYGAQVSAILKRLKLAK
ncbi:MAG: recombinase family protein [Candidatus Aminicenantes bacterium]|nr:recombinase family protein [Candidatus Aminicenantes bacterium]